MALGRPFPEGDEDFEADANVFGADSGKFATSWGLGAGACIADCIVQAGRKDEYLKKDFQVR